MRKTVSIKRIAILAPAILMLSLSLIPISQSTIAADGECNGSAPSLTAVTPSDGRADVTQDLLITGFNFRQPDGTSNVTSVFAVEATNPSNVVQASSVTVLSSNLADVIFNFGSANACKVFRIIVNGPCGPSASTAQAQFKTTCPTVLQRIASLRDNVTALLTAGVLSSKEAKPLIKKLNKAESKVEGGNSNAAIGLLQDFIDLVNEMSSEGVITAVEGQPLVDLANSIILQITQEAN